MVQDIDHRMVSIKPRLKYNTIGGVNGPLVILDNVRICHAWILTSSRS